jgi:SAM-dependent methyltransferase
MDVSIPHPARIYDYWLGGKDNFEADRGASVFALKILPELVDYARANRGFLVRAVRFLSQAGVTQFLDIGSGLPTSPNVHEVANSSNPGSRVIYVDNDPMVFLHAEALMAKDDTTGVIRADMRDTAEVLRQAGELLDLSEPVALLLVACLHHLKDSNDPAGVVANYLKALAPGSYLVLSHFTSEFDPERTEFASRDAASRGVTFIPRSKDAIAAMFGGRELIEPGLVLVSRWRPDEDPGPNADRAWAFGGVASLSPLLASYLAGREQIRVVGVAVVSAAIVGRRIGLVERAALS